jgi:predicted dehydrogenase
MRFAIIGTGFVADYYMTTLTNYDELELVGVFDADPARLEAFCAFHTVCALPSLQALLDDETIDLVCVLTNPESHFTIVKSALEAGKHVYCEKPLAMDFVQARALGDLASTRGLVLGGAPANALSDAFALTRTMLLDGRIGAPKLVYVEMEDGPVFRENWPEWRSQSGAPWPGKHEFEIGCTLEHAGYGLSWLVGLFGAIKTITGTSGTFFFDKGAGIAREAMGPDFSTACLTFESGVVARLTCGLCAPRNRALTIMGETGTLTVADLWDSYSAVHLEEAGEKGGLGFRVLRRLEAKLGRALPLQLSAGRRLAYPRSSKRNLPAYPSQIDFAAGIAAVADAATKGDDDAGRGLAARALHVTEAALALNRISDHGHHYVMVSTV